MTRTDQEWLDAARWQLARAGAARPVVDELVDRALALAASSGEPAAELFGAPDAWATAQLDERRRDGLPVQEADPASRWRDVAVLGLALATMAAVAVLAVSVLRREWQVEYSVALLSLPLLLGLLPAVVHTTWEKTLARRSLVAALAAGGAVTAAGIALATWVVLSSRDVVLATASVWWWVAYAAACAALSGLASRVLPDDSAPAWTAPRDDEEWLGVLAGALRLRAGFSETRVRDVVAEARAHATESGSTLQEEFGRPEDYAAQFSGDTTRRTRLRAWGFTAIAVVSGVTAAPPDVSWTGVVLLVGWTAMAVREWVVLARARRTLA